jgi:D-amino peptidase
LKRAYIVADMEGVSGVRLPEQCRPGTPDWAEARAWMTDDVNAAVGAAFSRDIEEVVVCDAHAAYNNIRLDDLDDRVILEQPFGHHLLPGLTEEFEGLLVIGAHAMAGTRGAFQDHSWNPDEWFRYRLAGDDCGEVGMWAAYAGHYNVPLLLVTGDVAACREAEALVPGVETVAVKEAISRDAARTLHPRAAVRQIAAAAGRALARAGQAEASLVDLPTDVEVEYVRTEFADRAAARAGAERTGPRTVRRELGSTQDLLKGF